MKFSSFLIFLEDVFAGRIEDRLNKILYIFCNRNGFRTCSLYIIVIIFVCNLLFNRSIIGISVND